MDMAKAVRSSTYVIWGALFALAGLSVSSSARADSLSCDGRIVSTGDSRYDVRSVCGEPTTPRSMSSTAPCVGACPDLRARQQRQAALRRHPAKRCFEVVVDEWIYDFGKKTVSSST